jgi:hypothetical protein
MFYFPALSAFMTYHRVCWFILYPYQAIDRLSKGSLSKDVESMRTKMFDKCIRNEMEEDVRKELTKIREECMELRQDIHNINTRHIPPNILSKLCFVYLVPFHFWCICQTFSFSLTLHLLISYLCLICQWPDKDKE